MPAGSCCMKAACMSMTEPDEVGEEAVPREPAPIELDPSLPRFATPIVPRATVAGRALIAIIAIMTFLGSMAIGAVLSVETAASDWQSGLAREVTIQVRPVAGRDIEADIGKAAAIARSVRGVAAVRPYSRQDSLELLQPWLDGMTVDELPIPRIIAVEIASGQSPDFAALRKSLMEQVPPASLDDHRGFIDHMRAMTRAVLAAGGSVLALVTLATVLSVGFATRGVMATNRQVIEVLLYVGAKNAFIAGHFQRHFLLLGLQGGAIGGGLAIALFALAGLLGRSLLSAPEGAQLSALFGNFSIGTAGYAAVLAQVVLMALVTAMTSRYTVYRMLETVQ
jgi:cell division transport system permease protein